MPERPSPYDSTLDPDRRDRIDRVVAAYETLMHHVSSAHAREFLEVGVTMSQAKLLYVVLAEPDLRMSALAARLGVSLSTVSGVVDRLVDLGLLTRQDDPANRRQVILRITGAGTTQLQLFRELNTGQVRGLLARIDDADLVVVERALHILAAAAHQGSAPALTQSTGGSPA